MPLLLALASLATQAPPEPPPTLEPLRALPAHFSCLVSEENAVGTVGVQRVVDPASGRAEQALFSWSAWLVAGTLSLDASWHAASGASPGSYSLIQLAYHPRDLQRPYRLRVESGVPPERGATFMMLEGPLTPSRQGFASIWTEWGPLYGMMSDALDPHIIVLDGAGAIVVDERLDPQRFARARALAERLRPRVDAMVADYRHRCNYVGRIVFPDED